MFVETISFFRYKTLKQKNAKNTNTKSRETGKPVEFEKVFYLIRSIYDSLEPECLKSVGKVVYKKVATPVVEAKTSSSKYKAERFSYKPTVWHCNPTKFVAGYQKTTSWCFSNRNKKKQRTFGRRKKERKETRRRRQRKKTSRNVGDTRENWNGKDKYLPPPSDFIVPNWLRFFRRFDPPNEKNLRSLIFSLLPLSFSFAICECLEVQFVYGVCNTWSI